ncbi:MAG: response regulator [Gemmatimonadaceae bacterium]|nr:response regulator [Chitinophagaceae bacterium]
MSESSSEEILIQRIAFLEMENAMLRRDFSKMKPGSSVSVPEEMKEVFDLAQQTVSEYFQNLNIDPSKGTIEINDQRYVLVRASTLSKDFLDTVRHLYADRGEAEAMNIGKNILFDIAHVIGMNDARNFHQKMNLSDPISKLSAGPVHFAYTGWAFVDILPESSPTPDENFYLHYKHPYSFEADSWVRSGKKADTAVCIMNSGYSSGWCEESFGISLTAVEVSCIAKGDSECLFIMSPPDKMQGHLESFSASGGAEHNRKAQYDVPTFFERKMVEEEMVRSRQLAEDSAKSKADFVANMSHELRTPLGAILGFTERLKKTNVDAEQNEYLEIIGSAGKNLLSIINDILDISKLNAGKFIIENIPFSISSLMQSVETMFAARASEKGLLLKSSVDASLDQHILGDPMRLTQILVNLIGNAIKFTEKGSITVQCKLQSEQVDSVNVLFTIRDTGIGIASNKLESIFERFTQADSNVTRHYGGTGLGLSITKQLIELQGGEISVESRLGEGSAFAFEIRFLKSEASAAKDIFSKDSRLPELVRGLKILLVEDNHMNQKLALAILHDLGVQPTLAENGAVAITSLSENEYDLILMDIQMPGMDGYEAVRIIRKEKEIKTPIVAMTAHALPGERENCIRLGMNDYLSKPFSEKELIAKIQRWTPNNSSKALTDLSFLKSGSARSPKLIAEMIGIFIEETPAQLQNLKTAIASADYKMIYKTVHTLRNSIGFFGLTDVVGNDLLMMEQLAHEQAPLDDIRVRFVKVDSIFQKAVEELARITI